jgi:hypothetical protein
MVWVTNPERRVGAFVLGWRSGLQMQARLWL